MKTDLLRKYSGMCLLLVVSLAAPLANAQNANTGEIKGTVRSIPERDPRCRITPRAWRTPC